jgi:hypothetical protein
MREMISKGGCREPVFHVPIPSRLFSLFSLFFSAPLCLCVKVPR